MHLQPAANVFLSGSTASVTVRLATRQTVIFIDGKRQALDLLEEKHTSACRRDTLCPIQTGQTRFSPGDRGRIALNPLRLCMQALTFLKMAPWPGGKVAIRYRRVNCVPPKDISVLVDNNRGQGGWLRLQIAVSHYDYTGMPICRAHRFHYTSRYCSMLSEKVPRFSLAHRMKFCSATCTAASEYFQHHPCPVDSTAHDCLSWLQNATVHGSITLMRSNP